MNLQNNITLPLVSICIPTYNGAQFLVEAMDSAITQTYPNLEIVVSDDDSEDETLAIVESYKTNTTIPIYIHRHVPNGIGANWNHCVKKAKGVYIKFLFQDDVLLSTCITEMVEVLNSYPKVAMVACKRKILKSYDYNDTQFEQWLSKYGDLQSILKLRPNSEIIRLTNDLFKTSYFFKSPLNKVGEPSTILVRKSIFKKHQYFSENLKQILDYEFYYKLLKFSDILIINKELVCFRLHENQASNINKEFSEEINYFNHQIYNEFFYLLPKRKVLNYIKKRISNYLNKF